MAEANGLETQPMQMCIGKDTIQCTPLDISQTFQIADDQFVLDERADQYHRDVGDARTGLEYYLRQNQAVVFFKNSGRLETLDAVQPHILKSWVNHSWNLPDRTKTIRKNVFIFDKEQYDEGNFATIQGPRSGPEDVQGMQVNTISHPKLNIFHIDLSGILDRVTYLHIVFIISNRLSQCHDKCKPKYTTDAKKGVIPAIHLNAAGLSLTHGYMSSRNGDTAFTTNLFSARTDVNGPFHARAGDDVFWIYNCEARMFDNKTYDRHGRCAFTEELLEAFASKFFVAGQNVQLRLPTPIQITPDKCLKIDDRTLIQDGQGNKTYPNFVLAIRPHKVIGSSLVFMASLRDAERVLGKVISGGQPYASIDWVHGAGTEM